MEDEIFAGHSGWQDELRRRLRGWSPDRVGTLLFLRRAGEVLLIRKHRGHGAGKINGPGGKPEGGETPLQCAVRETREEVGVEVLDPVPAARFRFLDTGADDWLGYVFTATRHRGEPRPSAEASPFWVPVDNLPFQEMWDDDRHWLPRVLAGQRLEGDFLFANGRLLAHRLRMLAHGEPVPVSMQLEGGE